jgi:hypothetical protein
MPIVSKIGTARFRRAIVDLIPSEHVKQLRDIIDVLHSTSVEILETKKKALQEGDQALAAQISRGKDIMSILRRIPCIFCLVPLRRLMINDIQSRPIWKLQRKINFQTMSSWVRLRGSGNV